MADDTATEDGDAPRTLFTRGRSGGKRKRGGAAASPLEEYPPVDPDEIDDSLDTADGADDGAEGSDGPELCPSCEAPLVPGAVFCGECGTRAIAADAAADA